MGSCWLILSLCLIFAAITDSNAAGLDANVHLFDTLLQLEVLQQTPWASADMQLQWEQRQRRALLQNPDRQKAAMNGRKGRMEDFVPPGYPLETHKVVTEDGWVLTVHRIPHGKQRHSEPGKRPVVLCIHGFSLSSVSFALYNANESMAYVLADAGFDVWMMNTRGNDFSRGNFRYSDKESEYWYISMDEMGLIDVPTTINYMLNTTGASKVHLLTHSQGGTLAYIMMIDMPHMQDKVASHVAMGPPCFQEYMKAPVLQAWARARIDKLFYAQQLSMGKFLTSRLLFLFQRRCEDWFIAEQCAIGAWVGFYGPSDKVSTDDWVVISNTWPATVASRDITHWAQMIQKDRQRLQRFDYGTNCANLTRFHETCNQMKYGSLEPPEYDLSKIRVPVFILQGSSDIMVPEEDVALQGQRIPTAVRINYDRWSHMDFTWDREARHALDVVDIFYRYSPGTY